MTNEQINIRIAEACGWTHLPKDPNMVQYTAQMPNGKWDKIPDYCNDLNAIIGVLAAQPIEIQEKVARLLGCRHDFAIWIITPPDCMCEVFLKTLGLWEEKEGA